MTKKTNYVIPNRGVVVSAQQSVERERLSDMPLLGKKPDPKEQVRLCELGGGDNSLCRFASGAGR